MEHTNWTISFISSFLFEYWYQTLWYGHWMSYNNTSDVNTIYQWNLKRNDHYLDPCEWIQFFFLYSLFVLVIMYRWIKWKTRAYESRGQLRFDNASLLALQVHRISHSWLTDYFAIITQKNIMSSIKKSYICFRGGWVLQYEAHTEWWKLSNQILMKRVVK